MNSYILQLNKEEVEYVLTVLGTRPFSECAALIGKIQEQVRTALMAAQKEQEKSLREKIEKEATKE